jgi:undecaprenyl-diphosphatase
MELSALVWIAGHRVAWLDSVMLALTEIGRGGAVWTVMAVLRGALRPQPHLAMAACQVVIAVTLGWIVPEAVKPLVLRPRPYVASQLLQTVGHERPSSHSFPSGHAASAVAGAYSLGAMWPAGRAVCWGLAALITFSRAYLGVHYPTDLVAGGLLGWLIAWFVVGHTRWR